MDEQRLPDLPEVPTLREKGIDVVSYSSLGYMVPKGTAGDIVAYLAWSIYLSTSKQGYQAQMRNAGLALGLMGGEQYAKLLSSQAERVKQLLPLTR